MKEAGLSSSTPDGKAPRLNLWRAFLLLAALHTLAALVVLLSEPSEVASQLVLGLSPVRLAVAAGMLAALAGFCWLLAITFTNQERSANHLERLRMLDQRQVFSGGLMLLAGLVFLTGCHFLVSTSGINDPFTRAVYARLAPLVFWAAGLSALALAWLVLLRFGFWPKKLIARTWQFWLFLALLGGTFLLWGWVVKNTLQTVSNTFGWYPSGAPLIETQVFLAWLIGLGVWGFTYLASRSPRKPAWLTGRALDAIICLALWGASVLLLNRTPLNESYFHTIPRLPNNEIYPNSDAMGYDMTAQQLLIGEGANFYNLPYVRRPMVALLVTASRLLGKQDYEAAAFWQITVLSLFPVLVYLLTKTLHSPLAGVMAGTMVILREANSIALSRALATSHAKLFMSDLPAALAVAGFLYFAVAWLKKTPVRPLHGLLAGGMLGIAVLIRIELVSLVFALGLLFFLTGWRPLLQRIGAFSLLLLGALLVTAPWIYRNWAMTGQIFLDSPSFHLEAIQERYKPTPTPQAPPESSSGAAVVNAVQPRLIGFLPQQQPPPTPTPAPADLDSINLRQVIQAVRDQPGGFAGPALSHLANNQVQFFLVLPTTFRLPESVAAFIGHRSVEKLWSECCSTWTYPRQLPYWRKWDGSISVKAIVPLLVNTLLLAVGLAQAWKGNRWAGLLPLAAFFLHIALNAAARNSGGRYILPVVWVAIPYFSIGLAEASMWAINLFSKSKASAEVALSPERPAALELPPGKSVWKSPAFYGLALGLVLLGSLLPALERAIPQKYNETLRAEMLAGLVESTLLTESERLALDHVLENQGGVQVGLALYPRHYPADKGEISIRDPFHRKPFAFTGFYLVNEKFKGIVLPMESAPPEFPNAVDALVVSCPDGTPLLAALYQDNSTNPATIVFPTSPQARLTCSTP